MRPVLPIPPDRHARRLYRASTDETARWAALFAVWVHMGAAGLLAALGPPEPSTTLRRAVLLVRQDPDPEVGLVAVGLGGAEAGDVPADRTAKAWAPEPRLREEEPASPATEAPELERFVRTDDLDEADVHDAALISSRSTRAVEERRTVVTSDVLGPASPRIDGRSDLPGSPTLERRDGERDAAGNVPAVHGRAVEVAHGGGGGGAGGAHVGRGSSGRGGPRFEGGEIARAGGGAGAPSGAHGGASIPAASVPSWWKPLAVRLAPPSPPRPVDGGDDLSAPSPTRGEAVAPVASIAHAADLGGTDHAFDEPALPDPSEARLGPGPGAAAGPSDPVDPVDDLRQALGWGGLNRDTFAPRPAWAGTLGEAGQRPTSPRTVFDDLAIGWEAAVNARGTPLGAYVERVEDLVNARWNELDLTAHERAVGISGQVSVRYVIHASGQVTDRTVARSSGHPTLDRMALQAIPERLPRFPRDLRQERIFHQVVLRYRNPLVATGMQQ